MLRKIVKKTIETGLILPGERVLAAVSGGPDSMCMLHVLLSLREDIGFELSCAHVNHLLRAEESDADEELVRQFCLKCDINFFSKRIDVLSFAHENKQSVEDVARRLRYAFLFEAATASSSEKIAVAHNMNDQAETMLMRFIRGSGPEGLAGISWSRGDGVIRPIMGCTRKQIEEYCAENDVPFRLDKTNDSTVYCRNKIRHELLPLLQREYNPAMLENMFRLADILQEEEYFWRLRIEAMYRDLNCVKNDSGWEFSLVSYWFSLTSAEKRRWIRHMYELFYGEPMVSFVHIEAAVRLADGDAGKRIDLPNGLLVLKICDKMIFTCQHKTVNPKNNLENYPLPAGSVLELEAGTIFAIVIKASEFFGKIEDYSGNKAILDYNAVAGKMQVRFRKTGDRFRPLGMPKSMKLKNFFINNKVPETKRANCPLVCDDNKIIWVAGSIIAEDVKISGKTDTYLLLEYRSNG